MRNDNLIQLFQRLGLTEYESKTLNALIKTREIKAPELSRAAEVPKTRVYDVLEKLIQRGLVIELQGRPKRYRAREPEKVLDALIEEKKRELSELIESAEKAKASLRMPEIKEEAGSRVLRVKDRNDLAKIIALELQTAERSVLGFAEVLPKHIALRKTIKALKEKDVDVRILHPRTNELAEFVKYGIDVRQANHGLEAYIIDDKKLVIALSDLKSDSEEYSFAIWHNSPIIEPLKQHFERNWGKRVD
ncbi:MAG: hypothetical protein J7L44_04525 [Candidatus Diapherotrites archaeon]|nr:hypothetical protein [Candidatus Diapherotrites archaeon]